MKKIFFYVNDKLKTNYDDYYQAELKWPGLGSIDTVNNIVGLCNRYSHKTILDIGSGEGSILKRLSDLQFGDSLYSIEISKSALEAIGQRDIKSLIAYKLFDGYNIPYEDNKFDLAILSHVIEHLEYPRKILYEAARVAKYIFIEVPLADNLRLRKDFVWDKIGHINFYSPKTITKLVQTCNLEVLSQLITNCSYRVYRCQFGKKGFIRYFSKELTLRIMPGIATSLWTYHCSLICRKTRE